MNTSPFAESVRMLRFLVCLMRAVLIGMVTFFGVVPTVWAQAPTFAVTINQAETQDDPTNNSYIYFTAFFSEDVNSLVPDGFNPDDVVLSGTAGATHTDILTATGQADLPGITFIVAVSGMTSCGTVIASIPAGVVAGPGGSTNAASTSDDNIVTVNCAPTGSPDQYEVIEGTQLDVSAPGVLDNDSDPDDGDTLSAALETPPSHAFSFTFNDDGSFSYLPTPGYSGPDSFSYRALDSLGTETEPILVSITVLAKPTIAILAGGQCSIDGNQGTIQLALDDAETDAEQLTVDVSTDNPALVPLDAIVLSGNGANRALTITPAAKKSGMANVTITVHDAQEASTTLAIQVIVGGNGKETLNGSSGPDLIFGRNGDDILNGGGGNDLLCGGNGDDILNGGDGDDSLGGGRGNDTLTGGSGGDFFSGASGEDSVTDFNEAEGDSGDGTSSSAMGSEVDQGLSVQLFLPAITDN